VRHDRKEEVMSENSVEEALRAQREDLHVEPDTEIVLGPENEQLSAARKVVEVRTFADLQLLGYIPESLEEGRVAEALARDDEHARELAREYVLRGRSPCSCGDGDDARQEAPLKHSYGRAYRDTYIGIQKSHAPNLARYMSDASGSSYQPGDLQVARVRGWDTALKRVGPPVMHFIWALKDVEIGKNATLTLGAGENGLYCGELRIHVGGRLVVNGSGVKIRCLAARGNLS
jgi:hypothetical protein